MLSLICIAMQLSIQAHAQQRVEQLIRQWAEKSEVSIGKIRYHLLRNGLILQHIHIQRQHDQVNIQQLLVKAGAEQLAGVSPHIGKVDISGLNAEITYANNSLWSDQSQWQQLWQSTTDIHVHDGTLKLYLDNLATAALRIHQFSYNQRGDHDKRIITASGHTQQQGYIHLLGQTDTSNRLHGELHWQHLNAQDLAKASALQAIQGWVDGQAFWQQDTGLQLHGSMQLSSQQPGANPNQLRFSAHQTVPTNQTNPPHWAMDLHATAWPLTPWSAALPQIGQHRLQAGSFNGSSHWQGHAGAWHITSPHGDIHDVIFTAAINNADNARSWYAKQLQYSDASIHTDKHHMHLSQLDIHHANIRLHIPANHPMDQCSEDNKPDWQLSTDKIITHQLNLSLALPQGNISLPSLHGSSHWPAGQPLVFKLQSTPPTKQKNQKTQKEQREQRKITSPAEIAEASSAWHLQGSLMRPRSVQAATSILNIRAQHIPLSQLRPLLPLQGDPNGTTTLDGTASLHAAISVQHGRWQMHGKASMQDVRLSHGGNTWQADHLQLKFGPVGMGLERQRISSFRAQHWHYTAALHPLPPPDQDTHADPKNMKYQPAWWATTLRNNNINIGQLAWTQGSISVGQPTSVWVDQANLTIQTIQPDQYAAFTLEGNLSGGDLQVQGAWNMLSASPDFYGTASLHAATPFFLHNWMNASGMPRLMRGRLSVNLNVRKDHDRNHYLSQVDLDFRQGRVETGIFPSDPMPARMGFSTADLLHQLALEHGKIKLSYELAGQWQHNPLDLDRLGMGLQHAATTKLQHIQHPPTQKDTIPHVETRIRLHHGEPLSMNERSRIFNIIRKLRQHPAMILDMKVEWSGNNITPDKQRRIQRTQNMIERYMTYRKIDRNRIYPLWPLPEDHTDGINAIRLETRTLK